MQFLVSFSLGKSAVHLYRYHGPNIDTTDEDTVDSQVLFSRFLSPVYEKTLTTGNEVLCRDFCMFTKNPNRMILASAVTSSLAGAESSSPSRSFPHSLDWIGSLDDLTFWVLDIATGKVLGKKIYLNDYVYLTNHSGVHMFDDYLAIASVQHQSIYINLIRDDGSLIELQCIGWNLFEDDELLAMRYNQNQMDFDEQQGREKRRRIQLSSSSDSSEIMDESSSFPVLLITEEEQDSKKPVQMLSGLKQRLMSFLFRKANMAPRYSFLVAGPMTFTKHNLDPLTTLI